MKPVIHDSFFKIVFSTPYVVEHFIRAFAPAELAEHISFAHASIGEPNFKSKKGDTFAADVVVNCHLRSQEGELPLKLALLLEHKSRPEKYLSVQVANYTYLMYARQMKEKSKHLELIVPMVIYQGKRPWKPKSIKQLLDAYPPELQIFLPHSEFHFINLQDLKDDPAPSASLQERAMRLYVYTMKHFVDLNKNIELIKQLVPALGKELATIFYLYLKRSNVSKEELMKLEGTLWPTYEEYLEDPESNIGSFVKGFLDIGEQRGVEKGLEKGLAEGREAERRETTIRTIIICYEKGIDTQLIATIAHTTEEKVEEVIKKHKDTPRLLNGKK